MVEMKAKNMDDHLCYIICSGEFEAAVRRVFALSPEDGIECSWTEVDGDSSTWGLSNKLTRIVTRRSNASAVRLLYTDDFGWTDDRDHACKSRLDKIMAELEHAGVVQPSTHDVGFIGAHSINDLLQDGEIGIVLWKRT